MIGVPLRVLLLAMLISLPAVKTSEAWFIKDCRCSATWSMTYEYRTLTKHERGISMLTMMIIMPAVLMVGCASTAKASVMLMLRGLNSTGMLARWQDKIVSTVVFYGSR